ncbi:peptidase M16 [Vibrio sp. MACH09]|uniref:M16 family metallopeptidase n=1 Tax=Vibrio sp. MACH09 TaxID=3025122 RepID=UPI00278EAAF8|nr:pitrilysin family protein [Vibrio sp. MACH09]GLO61845.1 peptidase M16 [Vibrio sp. MACH09]
MRKLCLGVLTLVALYGCSQTAPSGGDVQLPEGVTFIEQMEAKQGQISIPYSKYQLDNGLTLILSPDKSDPLVHVDVTYHVGSAREEIGRSGFAHFFEHMMFQGSENVGDQEHFRIITEAGGTLNGTTNRDRTNYFETLPSNQLEKALWLESDRMGFLIDAVSQRKFEIQRDTVKNERAQNYDNRPYGLMWERMGEALYPEGHPYSWQTIGYVEDLDRVDVNDLKAFFLRWYGPNNATLTIGGDIDIQQTLDWVNKYFGSIPSGPEVENAKKMPATLAESKFITLEDRIKQPMVMIAWPTTYRGEENQETLDTLASILGDGKNSILYQKLVKSEIAIDAGAFQDCAELACNFYVYAMGNSGEKGDLTVINEELMKALDEFKRQGVSQAQLDQIIGRAEANAVFSLESVRGKVSKLASNQTYYNQPDRIQYQLDRLKAVTPSAIMKAYDDFIDQKNSVTLSVVPKGQLELAVQEATFVTPKRALPDYQPIDQAELRYVKAEDNFDRSVMPAVTGAALGKMPSLYRLHLDNGIEVLGTVTSETPTVLIDIQLPAGSRYVSPGKEGLANLTAELIQEGTTERSVEQIQAELDTLGSSISFAAGNYTTTITISALEAKLQPTLKIVEEMLFSPAFKQDDFQRLKKQALEGLVYEHQKPSWLASQATRQVLFANTVYGHSNDGTIDSISSLTLQNVKDFYASNYTPLGAQVVVVGDISKPSLARKLTFLNDWQGEDAPLLSPQAVSPLEKQNIYLVDKPNAPQSIIRVVRQGLPYDMLGEQYLSQLANFNLSGNFNSRINQNLREDKGYTYGANGYHVGNKEVGLIVFSAQVRRDVTVESIKEFLKEMRHYSQDGTTDDEMQFMRLAIGQQDALKYETPGKKAQLLSNILNYSLDDDYIEQRNEVLDNIQKTQINEVASRWFEPSEYQIIVVGDAKSLKEKLETLNIPIIELEISK